jgi:hypothetical protein
MLDGNSKGLRLSKLYDRFKNDEIIKKKELINKNNIIKNTICYKNKSFHIHF